MNISRPKQLLRIVSCLAGVMLLLLGTACQPSTESAEDGEIDNIPEIQVTPLSAELAVQVDVANLRGGPGLDYDSVGSLKNEERITVDGVTADGDWYRLTDGSWIAAEFVAAAEETEEPSPPPQPTEPPALEPPTVTASATALPADTPTPTPTSAPAATATVGPTSTPPEMEAGCRTTTDVFLLTGPGSTNAYHAITSFPSGRDMVILGGNREDGNHTHYKVRAESGAEGWVIADSCPVEGNPAIEAVSYPPPFTPTFTPTPTPTPTRTPTPTYTPIPPDTPTPTPTSAASPTPLPPDTPTPRPTISETAVPGF